VLFRNAVAWRAVDDGLVIELVGVVVLLGRFPALSGLDLRVQPGELVVVRGPNGAGKTTLLRTCGGLLSHTSGTANVLGHDLGRDRRNLRRHVGMLGHANLLHDDSTVEDNVRFAVAAGRGDAAQIDHALTRLGLDARLRSLRVGACSAGQRRRTALAALVARQPRLWLLDEPHAGLDAASRDVLDDVVREATTNGATVLLASHDEERGDALATRTVTIEGGHVISDTSTGDRSTGDTST
jgi:heme ABC exporter ATP-binding subunit CcmA